MYVCMYVCVYMYVSIYLSICLFIYISLSIYIYTHTHVLYVSAARLYTLSFLFALLHSVRQRRMFQQMDEVNITHKDFVLYYNRITITITISMNSIVTTVTINMT